MSTLLKPRRVGVGDALAVISPASTPQADRVEHGMVALVALGYAPRLATHAMARGPLYFAGTPQARLEDLHQAFGDEEARAILCTRGGYGSNYLLDSLDLELIGQNPKPFLASSDLTAVQLYLLDEAGLPAFYGPMLSADFSREGGVHGPSLRAAFEGRPYTVGSAEGMRALNPGHARGTLYGGCLSILTALLGTPYEPRTEGKLLFLEDVSAKPYQVDRMLWQLRQAGKLEGVRGIVFGEMLDCASPGAPASLLEDAIAASLEDFAGPVAFGLRCGHVSTGHVTLTLGVEVELSVGPQTRLNLLEAAVSQ
ncbi:MAG: LD-carboxypeptidase [Terracidiphilus sp.]